MSRLVTDHLPLLAGAPNGVKKLRGLILELAVRGKLVAQDSGDEPASNLINSCAEAKTKKLAQSKSKKKIQAIKSFDDNVFHATPSGWATCQLSDLVDILNGRAYKKEELLDSGIPVLRVGNLFTSNHWYYSDLNLEPDKYCEEGDLIFAWSASFGPFIWTGSRVIYHYHIWKLDPYDSPSIDKHYLHLFLLQKTHEIKSSGHGVSMIHMTKEKMEKVPVPLPPLAEQNRIVAKVDELMALCDRLETRQSDAQAAHARLVDELLGSLLQARDAEEFAECWGRLAGCFEEAFSTQESIEYLRQVLLQLGITGKLTNPKGSWNQTTLGSLGTVLGGATPSKSNLDYWSGDIPWVSPKDMKRTLIEDAEDHINIKAIESSPLKLVPAGSLLMVVRGMILAHSFPVAMTARDVTINQDMKALSVPKDLAPYLLLYLQASKNTIVALVDRSSHGTCKLVSEKLWGLKVDLPPLEERKQIIAKLDELLALCDRLKARILQARQMQERLAGTLVERAVS
jgi:type I restriction enzyme, S subunit